MRKIIFIIGILLFFGFTCKKMSPSVQEARVTDTNFLDINNKWFVYYFELISAKGRPILRKTPNSILIYEFRDSNFIRTISGAIDSIKVLNYKPFSLSNDTIKIEGIRPHTINSFSDGILELEEYKDKITSHRKSYLKRIKLYHQSENRKDITKFLMQNSIVLIDTLKEKCKQEVLLEFESQYRYSRIVSCNATPLNWTHGSWNLNNEDIPTELFLKFTNFEQPIQIQNFDNGIIYGIRYGNIDSQIILKPVNNNKDSNPYLGNWKVKNHKRIDINEIRISNSQIELVFNNNRILKCDYLLSKNRILFSLKGQPSMNGKSNFGMQVINILENEMTISFKDFDLNKTYYDVKLINSK